MQTIQLFMPVTRVTSLQKEEMIRQLENDILSNWFWDNSMKVSGEKCRLMFFSNVQNTSITIKISNESIHESREEKLTSCYIKQNFIFQSTCYISLYESKP